MPNTSLERVVRPYAYAPFSWSAVFETSVIAKGTGQAANIGILVVSARTSVKTTTIKGAQYHINIKGDSSEVSRTEVSLTIQNPDNPDETIKAKALQSVSLRDSNTGQTTTIRYATPDPNDPNNMVPPVASGVSDSSSSSSATSVSDAGTPAISFP
jgi:hypothetical protein